MEMINKKITVGYGILNSGFVVSQSTDKDGTFMVDEASDVNALMELLSKITKTKIEWVGYHD